MVWVLFGSPASALHPCKPRGNYNRCSWGGAHHEGTGSPQVGAASLKTLFTIAYCLLPIAYCLLPIAYCLLPIAYCLLPIAYCLLPIAYCLLPFAFCLLP
ncbi:MAG: hypothetical protein F6K56_02440 [Moorea sp. SIO3G5]|nr:hypothetical protein [Moorena sp. SIO3G5]